MVPAVNVFAEHAQSGWCILCSATRKRANRDCDRDTVRADSGSHDEDQRYSYVPLDLDSPITLLPLEAYESTFKGK